MLNVDLLPHCAKVKHNDEKDKLSERMPMVYDSESYQKIINAPFPRMIY